jgi:hypothetical protein
MTNRLFTRLLPIVLVAFAAGPASAQIRVGVGFGPIEVRVAPDDPPPLRYEERHEQPGRDYIWIGGFWDREGDRWAWREGRWDRPSRRGVRWVTPVYRHEGGGTRYEAGHWSNQRMHEGDEYHRWNHDHGGDRGHGFEGDHGGGHGHGQDRHFEPHQ